MKQADPSDAPSGRNIAGVLINLSVAGIFAAACLFLVNIQGPMFSWDSSFYLIFIENFTRGQFDREANYAPLMIWTLGAMKLGLRDMVVSVNLYFFLIWAAIFYAIWRVSKKSVFACVFAFLFVFANPVTRMQFSFFWTEPGYALLLLTAILSLLSITLNPPLTETKGIRRLMTRQSLFLVSLSLLGLQRYIGGYMAIYLGIGFLLGAWSWREGGKRFGQLVIAAVPLALVMLVNTLETGHPGGYRDPAPLTFSENTMLMVTTLAESFRFEALTFLAFVLLSVPVALRKWAGPGPKTAGILALILLTLAPLAQLFFQVLSSSQADIDPINPRYVVVIVPLVIALFVMTITELINKNDTTGRALRELTWLAASVVMVFANAGHSFDFSKQPSQRSHYPAFNHALSQAGGTRNALVEGNLVHTFADDFLFGRFPVPAGCTRYSTKGSVWTDEFRFVPVCPSGSGPHYVPTAFSTWPDMIGRFDIVVVKPSVHATTLKHDVLQSAPACVTSVEYDGIVLFDTRRCAG